MDTKAIRTELKKELGYNSRQVSVKKEHYSSLLFTIRSKDVDYKAVEDFAHRYETIYRCEATGDILSGGNTFVNVEYSREIQVEFENKYFDVLKEWSNNIDTTNVIVINGIEICYIPESSVVFMTNQVTKESSNYRVWNKLEDYNLKRFSLYVARV